MKPAITILTVFSILLILVTIDDEQELQAAHDYGYCMRVQAHELDKLVGHRNERGLDCDKILNRVSYE